jgi:geranylgeranyl diphosphate synthase type I
MGRESDSLGFAEMNQPSAFRRYVGDLEAELRSVLGDDSSPLYTMMRYHLGWVDEEGETQPSPGKMSRPTLCLLACEGTGGDWHSALPAAAAVELIHNFSLIHDDIQDGSWERRHRPTVWKVWGEAQAINAGDAMYVLAQLALFRLDQKGIPLPKVILLSKRLNQASLQLCEGQYLDIEFERHLDIAVDQYLDMIDKKTAALFAASLYFGALLGTDEQNQVTLLSSFGRNLGMAYQVQNDLQGIWGEEENGKAAPYTDIRSKKKTLPIVYALHTATGDDREALLGIYGRQKIAAGSVGRVVRILDKIDARAFAEEMRDGFYRQCLRDLDGALPNSAARRQLGEVAAYLMGKGTDS